MMASCPGPDGAKQAQTMMLPPPEDSTRFIKFQAPVKLTVVLILHAVWCGLNLWILILNKIMVTEVLQSISSCDISISNFVMCFLFLLRCLTAQALSCPTSTQVQTHCMGRRGWRWRLKVTWWLLTLGTTALKCIATCSRVPALAFSLLLFCTFSWDQIPEPNCRGWAEHESSLLSQCSAPKNTFSYL